MDREAKNNKNEISENGDQKKRHNAEIRERNERVKQWLWRYREAKKDVRRLEEELHELIESQESCGAIEYSDMPKGGCNHSDLSDYMIKREKIWRKIHKARYKRIVVFQEIKNAIDRLPSADEREVMSYRYLRLMSWEKICVKIEKSWKSVVFDIHGRALRNMKIPEDFLKSK